MVETLGEDYIRTARAKGLEASGRSLQARAAGRASSRSITIFGLDFAALLAGAIFTERIFDIDGLGRWALEALNAYDLPVIMATVLVASVIIVAGQPARGHRLQRHRPAGEALVTRPA